MQAGRLKKYIFSYSGWTDDNTGDDGSTGTDTQALNFTVTDFSVLPVCYSDFFKGDEKLRADTIIKGSGFSSNLKSVELFCPDGSEYLFDEDVNSRLLIFSHTVDDSQIRITQNYGLGSEIFSGNFSVKLTDYNNTVEPRYFTTAYDQDNLMPSIIGLDSTGKIPELVVNYTNHTIDYSFPSNPDIGTKLVYMINRATGQGSS